MKKLFQIFGRKAEGDFCAVDMNGLINKWLIFLL